MTAKLSPRERVDQKMRKWCANHTVDPKRMMVTIPAEDYLLFLGWKRKQVEYAQRAADELHERYVRTLIRLPRSQAAFDQLGYGEQNRLIAAKREHVRLKRKIREKIEL
jgi:hypothetical protein